jgi:SAM-dependent methyltransferase
MAALDVATGGGHVARRLAALGCAVTTCDAAAGMRPDVMCPAEQLPFPDCAFDVVACRLALHHFARPDVAIAEMTRVSRRLVVLEDTLFIDDRVHEAERLRDSTHVRQYCREELAGMLAAAGLQIVAEATFRKPHDIEDWLAGTACTGETARRVRELLSHVSCRDGRTWTDVKLVVKGLVGGDGSMPDPTGHDVRC